MIVLTATILTPECSVVSNLNQPAGGAYGNENNGMFGYGARTDLQGAVIRTGPIPTRLISATFRVLRSPYDYSECGYSLSVSQLTDATVANYQPGTTLTSSPTAATFTSPTFSFSPVSSDYNTPSTIRCALR